MNTTMTAAIVSACLLASVLIGGWIRHLLPENHLNAETKDTVKLAMGLVATMSALLLGLLVSSAKGSYDTTRGQVIQMAAKVAFLDRVLTSYGPEAAEARRQYRAAVEEGIRRMWPGEARVPAQLTPNAQAGDIIYAAIQSLSPSDDTQRALRTQAASLAVDLAQLRTLLLVQSVSSISRPLLIMVVFWLVVIFLCFSLVAPSNATAKLVLMVAALSVAGAIFLILELDHPFSGLIRISSEPIQNVLKQLIQ